MRLHSHAGTASKEIRTESRISSHGRIWFQLNFGWDAKQITALTANQDGSSFGLVTLR